MKSDSDRSKYNLEDAMNDYSGANETVSAELAKQMVRNIQELKDKLKLALETYDITPFEQATHKMATTFGILQNKEMSSAVEEIKRLFSSGKGLDDKLRSKIELFDSLCDETVRVLSKFYSKS